MKKSILGIMAIVMAITVSSFTTAREATAPNTTYFWYVYEDGELLSEVSSTPLSVSEAQSGECDEIAGIECRRGFLQRQPQTFPQDAATGEAHIYKPQ